MIDGGTAEIVPMTPLIETQGFKDFFKDSKVLKTDGSPKRVFHGSPQAFNEFNAGIIGDPSRSMGAFYYFTDSVEDVNINYARSNGPDLKKRIEDETSSIYGAIVKDPNLYAQELSELEHIGVQEAKQKLEKAVAGQYGRLIGYNDLYLIASSMKKHELAPTEGVIYPAYLCIENPAIFSRRGGTVFGPEEIDIFKRNAEVVAIKYGVPQGELSTAINQIMSKVKKREINLLDFNFKVRNSAAWTSVKNAERNRSICGQLFSETLIGMGHDGAVVKPDDMFNYGKSFDQRTYDKLTHFKNFQAMKDATHYIVWNPSQIKSAIST